MGHGGKRRPNEIRFARATRQWKISFLCVVKFATLNFLYIKSNTNRIDSNRKAIGNMMNWKGSSFWKLELLRGSV